MILETYHSHETGNTYECNLLQVDTRFAREGFLLTLDLGGGFKISQAVPGSRADILAAGRKLINRAEAEARDRILKLYIVVAAKFTFIVMSANDEMVLVPSVDWPKDSVEMLNRILRGGR